MKAHSIIGIDFPKIIFCGNFLRLIMTKEKL